MDLQIDAKELLAMALSDVGPGEDIEEAILRACKQRFLDNYAEIFSELLQMIDLISENMEGTREEIIRELVEAEGSMSMSLHANDVIETRTFSGEPQQVFESLPEEMREEFNRALAGASREVRVEKEEKRNRKKVTKTVRRSAFTNPRGLINCRCGYLGPPQDGRCPKCGRKA